MSLILNASGSLMNLFDCVTLFTYVMDQIETPISTEILNGEKSRFYDKCATLASTTYLIFSKIRSIQFYPNGNHCKNMATIFFFLSFMSRIWFELFVFIWFIWLKIRIQNVSPHSSTLFWTKVLLWSIALYTRYEYLTLYHYLV